MLEYLQLLHIANDQSRTLQERIGVMAVLHTAEGYMTAEDWQEYQRISEEIRQRVNSMCNPAHAPRP